MQITLFGEALKAVKGRVANLLDNFPSLAILYIYICICRYVCMLIYLILELQHDYTATLILRGNV